MNLVHHWFCRSEFWQRKVEQKLLPWALRNVALGDQVLEVGSGPGLTTNILRHRTQQLTALEIDTGLADSLKQRLHGTNVKVIEGDATAMPFPENFFSGAVCFTMLHHVPSPVLQDQLLSEVRRVLKPGAVFAGSDSTTSLPFRLLHINDTMVMVEPKTFSRRLEQAGFGKVTVEVGKGAFRFRACKPANNN